MKETDTAGVREAYVCVELSPDGHHRQGFRVNVRPCPDSHLTSHTLSRQAAGMNSGMDQRLMWFDSENAVETCAIHFKLEMKRVFLNRSDL